MKIKYLGHSSFYIKGENFSVVTDPFKNIGYEMERVDADYCISSHGHFDHNNFEGVNAKNIITDTAHGFIATKTFHDSSLGSLRGENNVFKFKVDGITFCHLGDIGEYYSQDLAEELGHIDVLFVPVGGNYTIGWREAILYINGIAPFIAIPMHFKTPSSNIDVDGLETFLRHASGIVRCRREIELTKEELPEETQIYVMDGEGF